LVEVQPGDKAFTHWLRRLKGMAADGRVIRKKRLSWI
jgi:hypothetical protein